MLYYRYSANRIFFLNEYWVLVPVGIAIDYFFIRRILLNRQKKRLIEQEIARKKQKIAHKKRLERIMLVSLGLHGSVYFLMRGGDNVGLDDIELVIDTDYIRESCTVAQGVNYLEDGRLRAIILDIFRRKIRNKIIFITITALCHVARRYGRLLPVLPVALSDFGLTDIYQAYRKTTAAGLVTVSLILIVKGSTLAIGSAVILAGLGILLGCTGLDFIGTSPIGLINVIENEVQPRTESFAEVIVVNNGNKDRIVMTDPTKDKPECWVPYYPNANCKPQVQSTEGIVLPEYDSIVNMRDASGLDRTEFSDRADMGIPEVFTPQQEAAAQIEKEAAKVIPRKGKTVNFLDMFGDPPDIDEIDSWDVDQNEFLTDKQEIDLDLRTKN